MRLHFKADFYASCTNERQVAQGYGLCDNEYKTPHLLNNLKHKKIKMSQGGISFYADFYDSCTIESQVVQC